MKLEDQVITRQQSKRLKELGVTGDAIWYWVYPRKEGMISTQAGVCHKTWAEEIIADNEGDEFDHEMSAAYSMAELGLMLGKYWENEITAAYEFIANTEAEERAHYLIGAIESGQLPIEEINKRLNS